MEPTAQSKSLLLPLFLIACFVLPAFVAYLVARGAS